MRFVLESIVFKNKPEAHLIASGSFLAVIIVITIQFARSTVNIFYPFDGLSVGILLLIAIIYGWGGFQIYSRYSKWIKESKQ
ncbi:hypothetical protein [Shouchella xiaoxiensis]|uniref:hypothetical protein n=1 Tax=Shouchella xiaoxiensis TaxID=766895 RepID=UPI001956CCF6|nr:hypothetical protein [Shouchella xiaoxiensis]